MTAQLPPEPPDDAPAGRGPENLSTGFFFALFLVALGAVGYLFWPFFTDILLTGFFAVLTYPFFKWVEGKTHQRWAGALAATVLVVLLVAGPVSFLVTSLTVEAGSAFEATKKAVTVEKVREWLFGEGAVASWVRAAADQLGLEYTPEKVIATLQDVSGAVAKAVYEQLNALVSNVFAATFHFILIILMLFYFLLDGPRFKRYLFRLSPLPDHEEELIVAKFADVGRAILLGNGIGSVLQGILGGIAMWIVGLPSPILWGTVMSVFAFLPLVGIGVVVVPATIWLLIEGRVVAAILFFSFCMAEGVFVENVVKTKLIGDRMKMHNMVIFMAIIAGIAIFGVLGIIYGPLIVALFLTLAELYMSHYQYRFMTDDESAAAKTVTLKRTDG